MRKRSRKCRRGHLRALAATALAFLIVTASVASPPPVVDNVQLSADGTITWDPAPGATDYNVYRGRTETLARGDAANCFRDELEGENAASGESPQAGASFFYLVSAENGDEEGPLGTSSAGAARFSLGSCDEVVRNLVLQRAAFGSDDWTRARVEALGAEGFLAEQLDPASISEADNTLLNEGLAAHPPTLLYQELVYQRIIRAVHARRQLQESMADFWENHFNTFYPKVNGVVQSFFLFDSERTAAALGARYLELADAYRGESFTGTFRDILEAATLSAPMIVYLDTYESSKDGANQNHARELLELHSLGVDGGYVQRDVIELARVLTGWRVCRKLEEDGENPLAPCMDPFQLTPGVLALHFEPDQHDTAEKVLFEGTPQETIIPANATPEEGINDIQIALDALATHPSTARNVSRQLLEAFVQERPDEALIQKVVDAWTASGGQMRDVLGAVFDPGHFLDPARAGTKYRAGFESIVAQLRATRMTSVEGDPLFAVFVALAEANAVPYANPVPAGYPERGDQWLDTSTLERRQRTGWELANDFELYATDAAGVVNDSGLTEAPDIIDHLARRFFGGAISPAERASLIEFLETDASGQPAPFDDARFRETVGVMIGLPHFNEQ